VDEHPDAPDQPSSEPQPDGGPAPGSEPQPDIGATASDEGPVLAQGQGPEPGSQHAGGRRGPSRVLTHVAALVAGVAFAFGALFIAGFISDGRAPVSTPSPGPGQTPGPGQSPAESAPPSALIDGRSLGPADAGITIDIWADFQCPFCGLQAKAIGASLERELAATGQARITYRDFAFLGQESIGAAVAARCAGQQDAFWRYHDLLFASQRGENEGAFRPEVLVSLAQFANLDVTAFQACLADADVAGEVATETAEGRNLGISSTPTTIIKGPYGEERFTGLPDFAELEETLRRITDPNATPKPSPTPEPTPEPTVTESPAVSPSPSASSQ
jgi:protein-disulfide isomerase